MVTMCSTKVRYNSALTADKPTAKAHITIFHCVNALADIELPESPDYQIQTVKLPCSGLTREVVLLRALESGADAVLVLTCPQGSCRYLQGNLRAAKRVARVKKLLDEAGLDGSRLNIYSISHGDQSRAKQIITETLSNLSQSGTALAEIFEK